MEIETTRFGHVEIDEKLIITMPHGILGFEDFKRYCILDHFDKESPFKWLQSVDDPSLAFVITDPLIFLPQYKARVPAQDVGDIKLTDAAKAVTAVIVNIKRDHSEITVNLQGPIVINPEARLAKQVIIRDSDYSVRHVIFSAAPREGAAPSQPPASGHGEAAKPDYLWTLLSESYSNQPAISGGKPVYHERVQLAHKMADGYIIPLGMINLVSVVTDNGMVGCGAFDIHALDAFSYPAARAGRSDGGLIATIDDLLTGIIRGVNEAARKRGVAIGMSGKEALELM